LWFEVYTRLTFSFRIRAYMNSVPLTCSNLDTGVNLGTRVDATMIRNGRVNQPRYRASFCILGRDAPILFWANAHQMCGSLCVRFSFWPWLACRVSVLLYSPAIRWLAVRTRPAMVSHRVPCIACAVRVPASQCLVASYLIPSSSIYPIA